MQGHFLFFAGYKQAVSVFRSGNQGCKVRANWVIALPFVLLICASCRQASAQYLIKTFEAPKAISTFANGINNNGQVAGSYTDEFGETAGFIFDGKGFITVKVTDAFSTELHDINDAGKTVGTYVASDFSSHSFVSSGVGPVDVAFPGALSTTVTGINNKGDVTGFFDEPGASQTHGFRLDGHGPEAFDAPGSQSNVFSGGINDLEVVAGTFFDTHFHGFTFDGATLSPFNIAGATETFVSDINNQGDVVGFFESGPNNDRIGFVLKNGIVSTLTVPGAEFVNLMGINDSGTIVGYFADSSDRIRGFTATAVPETALGAWLSIPLLVGAALCRSKVKDRRVI